MSLLLFGVRPEVWMSHFSDAREGGNNVTKKHYKIFCENSIYISITVVLILLICTFYFFSVVHDVGTSTNELNDDLEES